MAAESIAKRRRVDPAAPCAGVTVLVAMIAVAACAPPCPTGPDLDAAFRAAWANDLPAMRALVGRDRTLANAQDCAPARGLLERAVSAGIGEAPSRVIHVAARQGFADFVALLVEHGADIEASGPSAVTPLHLAAQYGHDEVARFLIKRGARISARRSGGMTPLHLAASHGRLGVVQLLLDAGADPNVRDGMQWTPLHGAAGNGHAPVVSLLLDRGADVHARDRSGNEALNHAITGSHQAVVDLLLQRGASGRAAANSSQMTPLRLAIMYDDAQTTARLIASGADVNAPDSHGRTPLLQLAFNAAPPEGTAAMRQRAEQVRILQILLDAGARIDARDANGSTALALLAHDGRTDMMELLLARGANVNARNNWGWTPLHHAMDRHRRDVVSLLLEQGADVNARAKDGRTPLGLLFGDEATSAFLREHGAVR